MSKRLPQQPLVKEIHNDVVDETRRLMKRFNNRLTLDNLRLSERYLNGELHVLVDFRDRENTKHIASFEREPPNAGFEKHLRIVSFGNIFQHSKELIPNSGDFPLRHAMEPILRTDSEQQSVLVDVVKLMDLPKDFAAPSRVRFDLQECFYRVRLKTLFYSPNSGFEFLGAISNREINTIKRAGRISSDANQPIGEMIKGATQILDSISSDLRNVDRNRFNIPQCVNAVESIRCVLGKDWIRVTFEASPSFFNIENVFFGPF